MSVPGESPWENFSVYSRYLIPRNVAASRRVRKRWKRRSITFPLRIPAGPRATSCPPLPAPFWGNCPLISLRLLSRVSVRPVGDCRHLPEILRRRRRPRLPIQGEGFPGVRWGGGAPEQPPDEIRAKDEK